MANPGKTTEIPDYPSQPMFRDPCPFTYLEGEAETGPALPFGEALLGEASASVERAMARGGASRQSGREALFAEFGPWLTRLMYRYRLSREAREDAHGELYCHFCTLLDQFDPERGVPLEPYLYRNLGAFLYTQARSGWRRGRRELPLYSEDGTETVGHLAGDPTSEWNDQLAVRQVWTLLSEAVREIPERQQHVIRMRYCQELSYEEVADRLAIKPATARSLARHGLQSLRAWARKRQLLWD